MKTCWIPVVLALLLCGCGTQPVFETVGDDLVRSAMAQPREIAVQLPDGAITPVLDSDTEQVYFCEDYQIILETRTSGDVSATIQSVCGYQREDLTVMETQQGSVTRYEFVWACAGEEGDCLGRAVILDDGDYHYCMSVLRKASTTETSQIVWNEVFRSFRLV